MLPDNSAQNQEIICHWTARKMQPVILVYVAAVFIFFMLISWFIFHSGAAVKALLIAASGATIPLVPELLKKMEYRLTRQTLEYRTIGKGKRPPFKKLFELEQLSYIVPLQSGFKFYLILNESNPLRRFWNKHILSGFSGQAHVEKADLKRVLDAFTDLGVDIH